MRRPNGRPLAVFLTTEELEQLRQAQTIGAYQLSASAILRRGFHLAIEELNRQANLELTILRSRRKD